MSDKPKDYKQWHNEWADDDQDVFARLWQVLNTGRDDPPDLSSQTLMRMRRELTGPSWWVQYWNILRASYALYPWKVLMAIGCTVIVAFSLNSWVSTNTLSHAHLVLVGLIAPWIGMASSVVITRWSTATWRRIEMAAPMDVRRRILLQWAVFSSAVLIIAFTLMWLVPSHGVGKMALMAIWIGPYLLASALMLRIALRWGIGWGLAINGVIWGLPLIFGLYRLPIIPHGWEHALWYATAAGPEMIRQAQWAAAVLAIIIMGVSGRTNGNHTN
ncbi:MAG: hypothetical protein OWR62_14175 [Sulfobacillus thermotolerans]|nr:hypothetical protein [Sulfobacillus thermotolerans]